MKKYLVYELIHMPRNFFNKIIKENINISTEVFFLLSEITKEFPLKTIFNVSLIYLLTQPPLGLHQKRPPGPFDHPA